MGQLTKAQYEAAKAIRNLKTPVKLNTKIQRTLGNVIWSPIVNPARMNNLQSGPIMDIFRIIDSVHDIYDRNVQKRINALLPPRELSSDEKNELKTIRNRLNLLEKMGKVKGKMSKELKSERTKLQKRQKELEKKTKKSTTSPYPENEFVDDIFDFRNKYNGVYVSVDDKRFRAITFKSWIQQYLGMVSMGVPSLSDMKSAWKNKFLKLAQQRNMAFFDQRVTCAALPRVNITNSKMSRTLAGNVIKEYNLILATDALKTSDTLSNTQLNQVTVKTGLDEILNDQSLENNYIVNMAQVVDPSTNIKNDKLYRFAFVPLTPLTSSNVKNYTGMKSMEKSSFYELNDTNEQFTCNFKIIVEIMNTHGNNNPVINELLAYIQSSNPDFLSVSKTTPTEFFKYVRVYVFPHFTTNTNKRLSQQLSVNGLCIQTKYFTKMHPNDAWQEIPVNGQRSYFKIHNNLSGFSVDEVINFMETDIKSKTKDPRVIKWIIRHYLDWKRMGDSFQITHMKKLLELNNRQFMSTQRITNFQGYHPYHFVSIDILAIIQAIMFNVNFVYQINGNAFIIGNNQQGTPMGKYIVQVMRKCQMKINNKKRQELNMLEVEKGTYNLMKARNYKNNGYSSNNSNNNYESNFIETTKNRNYKYNNLNQRDLLQLLKQCRQEYLALKFSKK